MAIELEERVAELEKDTQDIAIVIEKHNREIKAMKTCVASSIKLFKAGKTEDAFNLLMLMSLENFFYDKSITTQH